VKVLGERYRFLLVLTDAQLSAFTDICLVDRVQRDEVGQVAYPIVIRVSHGVNRDAVSPVHRTDRYPSDGGLAADLSGAEELFDAVASPQGADGELPGEVPHPGSVVPSGLIADQLASRTLLRTRSKPCVRGFPVSRLSSRRRALRGDQLPRQRVQAVPDQLSVLVVAERVDSGSGVVQMLAGAVEVAELAVAVSEVEVLGEPNSVDARSGRSMPSAGVAIRGRSVPGRG
jgi:hypothetical protein